MNLGVFEPSLSACPRFPTASRPQKPPHLPPTLWHPQLQQGAFSSLHAAQGGQSKAKTGLVAQRHRATGAAVGLRAVSPAPRVVLGGEAAGRPLPVALLHQRLSLLLAGVLLAVVGLVQDLLGGRPPLEAIAAHLLAGGFGAGVVELASPLVLLIELWKEKQQLILTAFVCPISTTLDCLVEL